VLGRYAELAVRVGANVGEGQIVLVDGLVEHAALAREVARAAYDAGARFVDVRYADLHVRRAMVERAPDETLQLTPPWMVDRLEWAAAEEAAQIILANYPEPDLYAGLDQQRLGRAQQVDFLNAHMRNVSTKALNWTLLAHPSEAWAKQAYGEPDLDRLWADVAAAVRLDEPDPVAAWREHLEVLAARAAALDQARFDALRFEGPGTDLTIGLIPGAKWVTAESRSRHGRPHVMNLPTEEVYTSPDRTRTEGTVRGTIELALPSATIRGLQLRFEQGRIVEVDADEGADFVRAQLDTDEGARYLGEVALVDGTSRVGRLGRVFHHGLFDENATSHLAYGSGFPYVLGGLDPDDSDAQLAAGINHSSVHVDFMVGGPEVDVFGVTAGGDRRAVVVDDAWQLG
jgi:aminopeptidase